MAAVVRAQRQRMLAPDWPLRDHPTQFTEQPSPHDNADAVSRKSRNRDLSVAHQHARQQAHGRCCH